MTIGEKIREARTRKGMTQQELAEKLGYKSRTSINKIEVGNRDIPRSQIVQIAKVLDVTPAFLMGWEDKKSAPADDSKSKKMEKLIEEIKTLDESGLDLLDGLIAAVVKSKREGEQ